MNEVKIYDEELTNNVALDKCVQCKDCKWRDDGTVYSNDYRKSNCMMYPYPLFKPVSVMRNDGFCDYREVDKSVGNNRKG